jgi:hypothetical protein
MFFVKSFFTLLIIIQIKFISSDRSDDVCKNLQPNPTDPVIPDPVKQKSLLIVFDGTESMKGVMNEFKKAAEEIIKTFANREKKPIKNYVLVVFESNSMTYFMIQK